MLEPVRVGVIGCGKISDAYFDTAKKFPILKVVACSDLDMARAQEKAAKHGISRAVSVDDLLADPEVEVVLNLTVPKAHVPVSIQALAAGKHVYLEKPLGVNRDEARSLMTHARRRKRLVACAPDTVLGAGVQTARKLLDDGAIGRPVGFSALMLCPGHESWHPSPEFYYEVGGGPMFDMGPYYLSALLNLLGPVKRVSSFATVAIPERTITSQPKAGKRVRVETPDHVCGLMEFESGCAGTIVTSFAVRHPVYDRAHPIVIYGTDGAMQVPDPNAFDGTVLLRKTSDPEWVEMPHTFVKGYQRSVGLADMAYAIRTKRAMRCSGEGALAALDLMQAFLDCSRTQRSYRPAVRFERPKPMPSNLPFGELDE